MQQVSFTPPRARAAGPTTPCAKGLVVGTGPSPSTTAGAKVCRHLTPGAARCENATHSCGGDPTSPSVGGGAAPHGCASLEPEDPRPRFAPLPRHEQDAAPPRRQSRRSALCNGAPIISFAGINARASRVCIHSIHTSSLLATSSASATASIQPQSAFTWSIAPARTAPSPPSIAPVRERTLGTDPLLRRAKQQQVAGGQSDYHLRRFNRDLNDKASATGEGGDEWATSAAYKHGMRGAGIGREEERVRHVIPAVARGSSWPWLGRRRSRRTRRW
ncbi:hypothetical protein V8E36_007641 [Tilletia maclaganii]